MITYNENGTVTMSLQYYEEIMDQIMWLDALESTGVDNWEGHDEAVTAYKDWKKEAEEFDKLEGK